MRYYNNITLLFFLSIFNISFFFFHPDLSLAQTFTNNSGNAFNTWNGPLVKTISVSGLSNPLSNPANVLRQVNIDLGDDANSGNVQSFVITLQSPIGTTITIKATHGSMTVNRYNVKFRDHSSLRLPIDYGSTKVPFDIGYYRINTANDFSTFNGEDPNGTWTLTITESTATEISYNKVDLIFGSAFVYNDISALSANDECTASQCMDAGTIIIGTNNGYTDPGPATDPPITLGGCGWNGAQNNSAWFQFQASATTAQFTLSGLNNSLQILGFTNSGTCAAPTYSLTTGGCPDDVINDTYTSPQYLNGCICNMQLNMSSLTVGNTYYVVVDGQGGAISPFYIEMNNAQPCFSCATSAIISDSTNNICFDDSIGTATVSAAGGITPYSFLWSNGQTDSTATGLIVGTYSVTVTDNSSCTATVSVTITEPSAILINENASICDYDSVFLGGSWQAAAGTYYDTLTSVNGCDSVIATTLTVNLSYQTSTTIIICQGDSVFLSGSWQTTSGTYYDTLTTINGCDSMFATALTVNSVYQVNTSAAVCTGDSAFLGGNWQTVAGTYYDTLISVYGCDSIIITTLTVDAVIVTNAPAAICDGDSIFLAGGWQQVAGTYNDTFTAQGGCDSVVVTTLSVYSISQTNVPAIICQGDSIFLNGNWQSAGGIYYDTLTADNGCDSVLATTLTVYPVYQSNASAAVCQGDSAFAGGGWQTVSGTYYDTLISVYSCDSIIITTLSIDSIIITNTATAICAGDSVFLAGNWQTTTATYYDTLTAGNGCDSILATTLTVYPVYQSNVSAAVCQGDSAFVGGGWQTVSGTYYDTLISVYSCDSIIITTLSIDSIIITNTATAICAGDSVFLAGNWQTTTATYYDTVTTVNGCESMIVTVLTINPLPIIFAGADTAISEGVSVQLNAGGGISYSWSPVSGLSCPTCPNPIATPVQSTTYYVTAVDENDCFARDSVTLTVLPGTCFFDDKIMPNIFSPNGDGENDLLVIKGKNIEIATFSIYTRWGEKVFEIHDKSTGWDGTFHGIPLNSAVFIYYLIAGCPGEEPKTIKGNITLVR